MVEADPDAQLEAALGLPPGVEADELGAHVERRADRPTGVLRLGDVHHVAPDGHHGVPDVLVEGSLVAGDAVHHRGKVFVELADELLLVGLLADRGEAPDVGEEDGDRFAHAAEFHVLRVEEEVLHHRGCDVGGEDRAELLLGSLLLAPSEQDGPRVEEDEGERRVRDGQLQASPLEGSEGEGNIGEGHQHRDHHAGGDARALQ